MCAHAHTHKEARKFLTAEFEEQGRQGVRPSLRVPIAVGESVHVVAPCFLLPSRVWVPVPLLEEWQELRFGAAPLRFAPHFTGEDPPASLEAALWGGALALCLHEYR